MRFHRDGAKKFLRLNGSTPREFVVMGDCGAFSYAKLQEPPYTVDEMIDFYCDGQFTHGFSLDHVIFEFEEEATGFSGRTEDAHRRFQITQDNAHDFIKSCSARHVDFVPVGVVQGWSPDSMAVAARNLVKMGYRYIALGGLVPLKATSIHSVLRAVCKEIPTAVDLHILGFAKAEQLSEFYNYPISSFDSTSPLIRAFKDKNRNYYVRSPGGKLEYYTAIRIPQALENMRLQRGAKEGRFDQESLVRLENHCLNSVRDYDLGKGSLDAALESLTAYTRILLDNGKLSAERLDVMTDETVSKYRRTLESRPWAACKCNICKSAGVEVAIFRASNRNKRRGMHNLYVYYNYLRDQMPQ